MRELKYGYDNITSHGESQLDACKVFKNTRVWISINQDETNAIWITHKKEGPRLRNIIIELNVKIKAGTGNQKRVTLIVFEMTEQERSFASTTIIEYFRKFKDVEFNNRVHENNFEDSQKMFHFHFRLI